MAREVDEAINRLLEGLGLDGISVEGVGEGVGGRIRQVQMTLDRSVDEDVITRAVRANEESSAVLLLSLEIEHQLSMFLAAYLGDEKVEGSFHTLTQMLKAVRFEGDIFQIVDGFRRLRNKFAHEKTASLDKHQSLVDAIFSYELTAPTGQKIRKVGGVKLDELSPLKRLAIYAEITALYLAAANQVFEFRRPHRRIIVQNSAASEAKSE